MEQREKLHRFAAILVTLVLVQAACVLGEVIDANPYVGVDHVGTLTAEAAQGQSLASTEVVPSQAEPSPTGTEMPTISGLWNGTAQWLCDENRVWTTTLEFESNGIVGATLSIPGQTVSADGTWVMSGGEINLQFEHDLWVGAISGNTMDGTFEDNDCIGVWHVTKDQ